MEEKRLKFIITNFLWAALLIWGCSYVIHNKWNLSTFPIDESELPSLFVCIISTSPVLFLVGILLYLVIMTILKKHHEDWLKD